MKRITFEINNSKNLGKTRVLVNEIKSRLVINFRITNLIEQKTKNHYIIFDINGGIVNIVTNIMCQKEI